MWLIVTAVVLVVAWALYERELVGAVWRGVPEKIGNARFERSFSVAPFPVSVVFRRARVQLSLPTLHSTLAFELVREHPVHRWLKRWDMAREWQSGDAAFDAEVYVMADQPGIAEELCRPERLRQALMALLSDADVHSIHARDGRVWLETRFLAHDPQKLPPMNVGHAERLAAVAEALNAASIPSAKRPRERSLLSVAFLAGLSAALLSTGGMELIAAFYLRLQGWAPLTFELWRQALLLTGAVSLLLLLLTLLLLRHRSRLPKALTALIFLGIPGIALNSLFWVSDANREFDRSVVELRPATVLGLEQVTRRSRRSGNYTFCRIRLRDAREAQWTVRADEKWCSRLSVGSPAFAHVRSGWLGVSWLDGFDLQPSPPQTSSSLMPSAAGG